MAKAVAKTVTGRPVIHNLNVNVTNACNQNCPMCNARLDIKNADYMKVDDFIFYLEKLKPYFPATCTLSGGEPTLSPHLPEIIDAARRFFPFGVGLSTNLYGTNDLVRNNIIAALKAGIRISVSLDGFTDEANRQRGVSDAWQRTTENMKFTSAMKKELGSVSPLIAHTVISDANVDELDKILDFTARIGWEHRIAPIQRYSYQDENDFSCIHKTDVLDKKMVILKDFPHLRQSDAYLGGIPLYAKDKHPKLCPYLGRWTRYLKVFLDPDGSISMCNREVIGTLKTQSFTEIVSGSKYFEFLNHCEKCRGCWTACFVEPLLYIHPVLYRRLKSWKKVIQSGD